MSTRAQGLFWCGVALIIALSATFQEPWTYNGGLGWDGAQYAALAEQCWRAPLEATEPFAYRIGAPCLAALLPLDAKHALWTINVVSSVLLLVLLQAWLSRQGVGRVLPWLLAAFALHWLTPLRHVWWYPTYVDPLAMCMMLAALLVTHRPLAFGVLCLAGTLVRETMVIVPACLLAPYLLRAWDAIVGRAAERPDSIVRAPRAAVIAGLSGWAAGIAITRLVVTPTTDYWMLDSALFWAYEKPLPRYALAWFITFSPALVLLALRPDAGRRYLREAPEHALLLAFVIVLAWIGGTDTERFLLWGSPVVIALIGRAAADIDWKRATGPALLLLIGMAINGRWFVTTPDHVLNEVPRHWPLLTPLFATRSALLFSESPDRMMSAVALAQYVALAVVLYVWFRRCENDTRVSGRYA